MRSAEKASHKAIMQRVGAKACRAAARWCFYQSNESGENEETKYKLDDEAKLELM